MLIDLEASNLCKMLELVNFHKVNKQKSTENLDNFEKLSILNFTKPLKIKKVIKI
jgi:hypothetical protein